MKKKTDKFACKLMSPKISATDAHIFHRSIYIPSMRYSLSALAVDEEALAKVQGKIMKTMPQKMHIHGNLPTSIRHGLIARGGADIYDLRTETGLEGIKFLRNAMFSDSENGKLMRINLQYSQMEAGIGKHLLEHPDTHIPYLTPTWLMSIRHFLSSRNTY